MTEALGNNAIECHLPLRNIPASLILLCMCYIKLYNETRQKNCQRFHVLFSLKKKSMYYVLDKITNVSGLNLSY